MNGNDKSPVQLLVFGPIYGTESGIALATRRAARVMVRACQRGSKFAQCRDQNSSC